MELNEEAQVIYDLLNNFLFNLSLEAMPFPGDVEDALKKLAGEFEEATNELLEEYDFDDEFRSIINNMKENDNGTTTEGR